MYSFTFGLDFGTSKTAVALAKSHINAPITDVAIDAARRKRIPTCVARKNDTVWVGYDAENAMMMADPDATDYQFYTNFKYFHQNTANLEIARQFLVALSRADGLARQLTQHAHDAILVAGCPIGWQREYAAMLKDILRQAGFPPVSVVPEPVGAALYFFATGELSSQDLHRDIVVFDWGAGTFDMALLRAGQLRFGAANTFGSAVYGGRLFDDLFYQWLLDIARETGPRNALQVLRNRPAHQRYLQGMKCREIKESFSSAYAGTRDDDPHRPWTYIHAVTVGVGEGNTDLGNFIVPHLSDFENRMRTYRASDMARQVLQREKSPVQPAERAFVEALLAGEAVDLEAWGRTLVATGLNQFKVEQNAIAVLTGGSCNWRWFKDLVGAQPAFAGREQDLHVDDEPQLTIARGLARTYAVADYSRALTEQVEQARTALMPALCEIRDRHLHDLAYRINAEMLNDTNLREAVLQIFVDYYRDALAARKAQNRPRLGEQLERQIGAWLTDNGEKLQRRWGNQFAYGAHQRVMGVLQQQLRLEGPVEVAITSCGAIGSNRLDDALKNLGGVVKFDDLISRIQLEILQLIQRLLEPGTGPEGNGAVARFVGAILQFFRTLFAPKLTPAALEAEAQKQAAASTERFFKAMPNAIRQNIEQKKPPKDWADQVINNLIATLATLAAFARVDAAAPIE